MPRQVTVDWRKYSGATVENRHALLLDAGEIILDSLVAVEVLDKCVLVQVAFQAENLARNLLVLPLDPLQLRFPLVKVQRLRLEFNIADGVALAEGSLGSCCCCCSHGHWLLAS